MKTMNEIAEWMKANGYMIIQSLDEYWYCVHANEGDEPTDWRTAWMDSACEDAYDYDQAMLMAYDHIQTMEVKFTFDWRNADEDVLKSKDYMFHDLEEARKHAFLLLGEDCSGTDHIAITCEFFDIWSNIVRYGE